MSPPRRFWTIVLSSAAILAVTMGIRQSTGLFVSPLNSATGLGIVTISLALAIGQFVWSVAQHWRGLARAIAAHEDDSRVDVCLARRRGGPIGAGDDDDFLLDVHAAV